MPKDKNQQIDQILTRGVEQVLPDKKTLTDLMNKRTIRLYLGIDPTGSLLTLGHAVVLRKIQQFADLGHDVILLIGNGTVKIGDPTGKDSTRPMLTDAQIEENFKDWKAQASKILDFSKIKIMRNGDWLDKITLPEFIKLMAKTTVQQLMERDMFQDRIKNNQPIHGHEILYPMLQGYDSVAMDVDLEVGGSDQTFNMMMGRTLQKAYNNKDKWVLSTPIINGLDGRKMSKSYSNFIAITENPTDMYGKLMSMSDEMIFEYFVVLTDLPMAEIEAMKKAIKDGENPMIFKKKLAFTITEYFHDIKSAQTAAEHFEQTVQKGEAVANMESEPIGETTCDIVDICKKCPCNRSRNDLRRLSGQGGITVFYKDGKKERITDPQKTLKPADIEMVKIGKRNICKINIK
jgi:tyrosyl-tRNA synthetase